MQWKRHWAEVNRSSWLRPRGKERSLATTVLFASKTLSCCILPCEHIPGSLPGGLQDNFTNFTTQFGCRVNPEAINSRLEKDLDSRQTHIFNSNREFAIFKIAKRSQTWSQHGQQGRGRWEARQKHRPHPTSTTSHRPSWNHTGSRELGL